MHRRTMLTAMAATPLVRAGAACGQRDQGGYIEVNGDRQWLLTAGNGPTVLVLHGGPGASETVLFRHFNRQLECYFRMAYWDQRGAGWSFDSRRPPAVMTIQQFVKDLHKIVLHLRQVGQPLFLLGHSWGSALGMLYAREHPELISGFIGVGQVADHAAQLKSSWAWALSEGRRRGNLNAVQQLEALGDPPFDVQELKTKDRWVEEFGGYFAPGFHKMASLASALILGDTSVPEVRQLIEANNFSLRQLWTEVGKLDLPMLVPKVSIPVAFLLGRHDRQCPPDPARAYLEQLHAPDKSLTWFEHSAHNPPFEQPAAFNCTVRSIIDRWLVSSTYNPNVGRNDG